MEQEIFKKGDRVYHFLSGWGTATAIKNNNVFPIFVEFDNGSSSSFTLKGKGYANTPPVLSFTEYDLVNGGFSQDREDAVIFTNSKDEDFTKKWLDNNEPFWVDKERLKIDSWHLNINCIKRGEDESNSEVFKTREGAEKWLEEYKNKLDTNKALNTYGKAYHYLSQTDFKDLDKKISIFNQLLTIVIAWNKKDDFIPDYSNPFQLKYSPYFVPDYRKKLKFKGVSENSTHITNPFTFKTKKRARQFGTQFIDLFKQLYK